MGTQHFLVQDNNAILRIDPDIVDDVEKRSDKRGHIVVVTDGTHVAAIRQVGASTRPAEAAVAAFRKSRSLARGNTLSRIINGIRSAGA